MQGANVKNSEFVRQQLQQASVMQAVAAAQAEAQQADTSLIRNLPDVRGDPLHCPRTLFDLC
jgi:hypothetical protein